MNDQVAISRRELDVLLAVAEAYLTAFTDSDVFAMSLPERTSYSEVVRTVEKHRK